MNDRDTIAAPATAVGGAVSIIRIDGPEALTAANRVWHSRRPLTAADERRMRLGQIGGNPTLAVYMQSPRSYTGNDVVELQCHGGAAAANAVMRSLLGPDCRLAEPGEFTYRAFLNGKLDLVQAEAVADLVAAGSERALALAERQLAGTLSAKLQDIAAELVTWRAECESRLDFPDEELDFVEDVPERLRQLRKKILRLQASAEAGRALRDGVQTAIAGRPNAGKSSLLNALLGFDRAIVTGVAGTTRDTVESLSQINGIPVKLIDTAGLRESSDPVEQLGVARSKQAIAASAVILWVLDASSPDPAAEAAAIDGGRSAVLAVWNKCDLPAAAPLPALPVPAVRISALTGAGLEELKTQFVKLALAGGTEDIPEVAVNAREAAALAQTAAHIDAAIIHFDAGDYELAALELAGGWQRIAEITGQSTAPDVLEQIFLRFCLGK